MADRVNKDEYLATYPADMAILTEKIRNKILEVEPEFDENIRWKNLTYGKGKILLALVIHQDHVNLQFTNGRELNELGYPLEGTGKNMRHIKITPDFDFESELIPQLIAKSMELFEK
jgi:uncharacterized protein YdhG (YjbR/CyaY superfamily)